MARYLDVHVLQTVPPSNLNRDDTGSPKTATYGGVLRARASSQAWKRAAREHFNKHLDADDVGYRTLRVVELVADRIATIAPDMDAAERKQRASSVLTDAGLKLKKPRVPKGATEVPAERSEYLVFLSSHQIGALAELAMSETSAERKKQAKAVLKAGHSIDIALFGRMVADDAALNVDAAVQVAHALSTHAIRREYDYYTAVDDMNPAEETGAGMIGTVEFNSATLYRYATVNVDGLFANLGDLGVTRRALRAFVDGFVRSMPTGKQNSFANGTLPDAVVAVVRDDRPINLVGAFERPIPAGDEGYVPGSAEALTSHLKEVNDAYGAPTASFVMTLSQAAALRRVGESRTLSELVAVATAEATADIAQATSGPADG
jgi:CRISPR system Cascade subunit CasC